MTQFEKVKQLITGNTKSIDEIESETGYRRPNIRRILGQGAKKGIFRRMERGIYTYITESGEQRAFIKMGDAQEVLADWAEKGKKFDMVFLDPAYYSRALIGGNRGIKQYNFIMPEEFRKVMESVNKMMKTPDSHVYLMLSGAATAQEDMAKYLKVTEESGFKLVEEGKYQKMFGNGKPVTNVRGQIAQAEKLLLLTQSGIAKNVGEEIVMHYQVPRPAIRGNYSTQKAEELIEQLIYQSTVENDHILDPFAGSGVIGKCSILMNRIVYLVDKSIDAIEQFIAPKFKELSNEYVDYTG